MDLEKQLRQILNDACESGEECGLQLTIFQHGEKIVELAAGWTDASRTRKVTTETLFPIFSCGKPVAATAVHQLVQQGKLSYDLPLGDVWPEFRTGGREKIRLSHVMSHTAGMARLPDVTWDEAGDWEFMCRKMAEMSPETEPGKKCTYHGTTYSWLLGETVRRATGENFRDIIYRDLFTPLGIRNNFFYGTNDEIDRRIAKIDDSLMVDPIDKHYTAGFINNIHVRHGFLPGGNAHATATALATHYAALLGEGPFQPVLDRDILENATTLHRDPDDPIDPNDWTNFGLGYALISPTPPDYGNMFGQGGACGSEGFADKVHGLAVGFTKIRPNPSYMVHPIRDRISAVLGLPVRHW